MPYTEKDFRDNLKVNPQWQVRAVLVLWDRQTAAEQAGQHTGEVNYVGFSKYDADVLSRVAKAVLANERLPKWMYDAMAERLPKYAGQLWKPYVEGLSVADRYEAVNRDKAEKHAAAVARKRARTQERLVAAWNTPSQVA